MSDMNHEVMGGISNISHKTRLELLQVGGTKGLVYSQCSK